MSLSCLRVFGYVLCRGRPSPIEIPWPTRSPSGIGSPGRISWPGHSSWWVSLSEAVWHGSPSAQGSARTTALPARSRSATAAVWRQAGSHWSDWSRRRSFFLLPVLPGEVVGCSGSASLLLSCLPCSTFSCRQRSAGADRRKQTGGRRRRIVRSGHAPSRRRANRGLAPAVRAAGQRRCRVLQGRLRRGRGLPRRRHGRRDEVVVQLAVGDTSFWVADESPPNANFSPESLGGSTMRLLLVVDDPAAWSAGPSRPVRPRCIRWTSDTAGDSAGSGPVRPPVGDRQAAAGMAAVLGAALRA